jgi:CRISPR-associated protein (TIGR02710 family)
MKALIISIGTGARPGEEAIKSLGSGITYSIHNSNPDKVFFVVSKESLNTTLPEILGSIDKPYEIISIDDPDDINKIYENLSAKFRDIRKGFDHVTVDFTSGTKAMTGALTILGSFYEADSLSYVTGKRSGGIVIKGTERLLSLRPYSIIVERKLSEAVTFFNKCQLDSCLTVIEELLARIPDPELLSQITPFRNASLAYSAWDRFDHRVAFQNLKEVKLSHFDRNKGFLGRLLSGNEPQKDPYFIADLISNAKRRGEIEHKYDDAVARLYRTIELIAQYRLKKYGIDDTGNVPKEKIPSQFINELKLVDDKAKIGLYQAYQFLAALDDNLGQSFLQDKKLKDLLQKRNASILAHGLTPVTKEDYEQLRDSVVSYAERALHNIGDLMSQSTFVSWPET